MIYQVALDAFHGPLDLLLYLVKRNEVDARDIPVARIAEQFLDHLHALQAIDVEWAGEFLVMAATLMELKSRLLLPRADEAGGPEPEDPRKELVRQLVEYRKTKDAAGHLDRLVEERQYHVPADAAGRALGPGRGVRPAGAGDRVAPAVAPGRGRDPTDRLPGPRPE